MKAGQSFLPTCIIRKGGAHFHEVNRHTLPEAVMGPPIMACKYESLIVGFAYGNSAKSHQFHDDILILRKYCLLNHNGYLIAPQAEIGSTIRLENNRPRHISMELAVHVQSLWA